MAETPTSASSVSQTHVDETAQLTVQLRAAKAWNLTPEEWHRVKLLREGIGGYWDPNLDPLTLLGIHAETEQERRYYAEKLAKLENDLYQRLDKFRKARAAAWKRLYPDAGHFDLLPENYFPIAGHLGIKPLWALQNRMVYFVSLPCPQCKDQVGHIIQNARRQPVDIYFLGADDDAIRQWAAAMEIPSRLVKERLITLNHDNGLHQQVGVREFPVLYKHDGKRYIQVEISADQSSGEQE